MRNEHYEVQLLTLDGRFDKVLTALPGGSVTASRSADIVRSASLSVLDTAVPWESSLVRVMYDSSEFSRALITGVPSVGDDFAHKGRTATRLEVYDMTDALRSDRLQIAFGVAAGTNIVERVKEIIDEAFPLAAVSIPDSPATLAADLVFEVDTPKLDVVDDLLKAAGYERLTADGMGVLHSAPVLDDALKPVSERYANDATSLIAASGVTRSTNRADVPNRLKGIRRPTAPSAPADVYIAENVDPASPFSYAGRGYRWIDGTTLTDVDAADYEVFKGIVEDELKRRTKVASEFSFSHPVGNYDVGDVVTFAHSLLTEAPLRCTAEELVYTLKVGAMVKGRYAE